MADHPQAVITPPSPGIQSPDTHGQVQVPIGGGDSTPPVIDNFSPAVGTPLNRNDTVSFDVVDLSGLQRAEVFVTYAGSTSVVHDGEKFRAPFSNYSSRAAIAGGFRYTVRPNGGWTTAPTFEVHATDTDGNEAA